MRRLRVAAAQINCRVGDLGANTARILDAIGAAKSEGADLVAFPELAITGYPPEDLLLKPAFIEDNLACLREVAGASDGIVVVVGFVDVDRDLYNAAAVLSGGEVQGVYHKQLLPNYGVFDEARYFGVGAGPQELYCIAGVRVGLSVCEDAWAPDGPISTVGYGGAEVIVNINASPYHRGRHGERFAMLSTRAQDVGSAIVYVNLVGGQDELVFDGQSVVLDAAGRLLGQAKQFEEDLLLADIDPVEDLRLRIRAPRGPARSYERLPQRAVTPAHEIPTPVTPRIEPIMGQVAEVWAALVCGVRDYVIKNGFSRVWIGLSGGIDSSVVAAVAADALGPAAVTGVSMPSAVSSVHSRTDAVALAARLGITCIEVSIEGPFDAMVAALAPHFVGTERSPAGGLGGEQPSLAPDPRSVGSPAAELRAPDLAIENIQARARGNILMALSNKFGGIVLTTGNKSEMATGYCTLYGDMAGGHAVIKDVPKLLVYELARWRNTGLGGEVIPQSVIDKPPSAELRADQLDTDSLPPYDVLDPILEAYVEDDRSAEEIVALGHDPQIVARVIRLVDRSEYKRRQAPPGVRVTRRAFGKDRRLPITSGYLPG